MMSATQLCRVILPAKSFSTYTNEGYTAYQGVNGTPVDVLVNQNVTGIGPLPGVIETTTGGTKSISQLQDLLGDSNLLSNAIQKSRARHATRRRHAHLP